MISGRKKKTVFKYKFLVLFSYPWPAGVIQNSGGLKMDSEVNLQMPTYKDFEKALRDERVTQGCKGGCQIFRGLDLSRKATF